MNAIIVYNAAAFFKAYKKLEPDTWLVWVDSQAEKKSDLVSAKGQGEKT